MYVFKPALLPPDPASRCLQLRRNLADHLPINTPGPSTHSSSRTLLASHVSKAAPKRSGMEEQVFGKMSALSLSLYDISNDGTSGVNYTRLRASVRNERE